MTQTPSDPSPHNRPAAWPLIGAIVFMVVSLGVAGLVISGFDVTSLLSPATPLAATPQIAAPDTKIQVGVTATATTAAPQSAETRIVISLVPPQADTSGLADRLPDAIRNALEASPLAGKIQFETAQPDLAGGDLEIGWQSDENGLQAMTMQGHFEPALAPLDGNLPPYAVIAPETTPLYLNANGDLAFPAGLIAAFLQLANGPDANTQARIQALQALPSDLPPDKQAANQALILFAIGQAQAALGNPAAALDTYSQALRLQPDFPAAIVNRGTVYLMLGDNATALTAFQSVGEAGPYQVAVQYNQALASAAADDLDAALAHADALANAHPSQAWAVTLRGVIHYQRGEYEAALADFTQADSLSPRQTVILSDQAQTYTALKKYDQALEVYAALIALEPQNAVNRFQQAMAYKASGKPADALNALSQAIALNDGYVDAYLERGQLEVAAEDYDKALADAERVLTLDPANGAAYQITGDCLLAQKDWIKAEKAYTAANNNGENNADLFANRGWAHHRQREIASAIDDYQQALDLGDHDTTLRLRLGFALLDFSKRKDALNVLTGAVNGGLDTAEAHAGLALALDMNYREDEANQEYKRALVLDPRYGDRKFLFEQPLWTSLTIGRAMAIFKRLK